MVKAGAQDRVKKYDAKRTKSMPVAYSTMVAELQPNVGKIGARAEIDSKVAAILTNHDVPSTRRIDYHNFARYIEKRVREGTLTPTVVEAAKAKWIALGCEEDVLNEIISALTGAQA